MPNTAIVAMTCGQPTESVAGALLAGARGYLFKPFSRSECHEAILHAFSSGLHPFPK